jgi:hypothetical protein
MNYNNIYNQKHTWTKKEEKLLKFLVSEKVLYRKIGTLFGVTEKAIERKVYNIRKKNK